MKNKVPIVLLSITSIALAVSTATFGYKYFNLKNSKEVDEITQTQNVTEQKDETASNTLETQIVEKSIIPVYDEKKLVNKNEHKQYTNAYGAYSKEGKLVVYDTYAVLDDQLKYDVGEKISDALIHGSIQGGAIVRLLCIVTENGDVYMRIVTTGNSYEEDTKLTKLNNVSNICKIYPSGNETTSVIIGVDTEGNCYDLVDLYSNNN